MALDDSNSKALLHFDGNNNSTTFVDESGKTWTAVNHAHIDTSQYKFGFASAYFDGVDDLVSTGDSADWRLDGGSNANKWTVDFWVRFDGAPGATIQGFLTQWQDDSNFWVIRYSSSKLSFLVRSAGTNVILIEQAWTVSSGVWYHVAIVKDGTNGYMHFINGVQTGTTTIDTTVIPDYAGSLYIGAMLYTTDYYFKGWKEELRISKGVSRWTSNFTPPTRAYAGMDASGAISSISGSLTKVTGRALSGAISTISGSLIKTAKKLVSGTIANISGVILAAHKAVLILGGSISLSGTLDLLRGKVLQGTIGLTGRLWPGFSATIDKVQIMISKVHLVEFLTGIVNTVSPKKRE